MKADNPGKRQSLRCHWAQILFCSNKLNTAALTEATYAHILDLKNQTARFPYLKPTESLLASLGHKIYSF